MNVRCFLVVDSKGAVRVTKNRPYQRSDEIAIGLSVYLPDALFEKPMIHATLTIPDEGATPSPLPVELVSNVAEAIRAATGLQVRVSLDGGEEATA